MTLFPELLILRHLASHGIGAACAMALSKVRARLVMLESMRVVAGRQDPDSKPPRRVYRPQVGESFAFAEDLAGKRRQLDKVEKDLAADATASLQPIAA